MQNECELLLQNIPSSFCLAAHRLTAGTYWSIPATILTAVPLVAIVDLQPNLSNPKLQCIIKFQGFNIISRRNIWKFSDENICLRLAESK